MLRYSHKALYLCKTCCPLLARSSGGDRGHSGSDADYATQGPFDPYKILGVRPNASKDEIKRAYRRLALRFHPDGGPEGNAARFTAVHEAYEALKDGKWQPSQQPTYRGSPYNSSTYNGHGRYGGDGSNSNNGVGWDPTMRMYVYERPGSTTEGYVSGQTEKLLRLFMIWCFLFVIIRFSMFYFFPKQQQQEMHISNELDNTRQDINVQTSTTEKSSQGEQYQQQLQHQDNLTHGKSSSSVHYNDDYDILNLFTSGSKRKERTQLVDGHTDLAHREELSQERNRFTNLHEVDPLQRRSM